MKYCTKCGNELLDEAVICPKCGCAVSKETNTNDYALQALKVKRKAHITSAQILTIIAFVISLVSCWVIWMFNYDHTAPPSGNDYTVKYDMITGNISDIETADDEHSEYQQAQADNQKLLLCICMFGTLAVVSLILGLIAAKGATRSNKKIIIAYIVVSIANPVLLLVTQPMFMYALLCGIGLIILVPPILQLIAGGKLLSAASIDV